MRGNSASFVRSRGSALAWNCVELILVANDFESAFGDTRDSGGRTRMGGNGEGSVPGIEAMGWTSRGGGVGGEDAVEWKTSIVRGESPGGEKRTERRLARRVDGFFFIAERWCEETD